MSKFRVCCNLSFMYLEYKSLLQRYSEARKSGFKAVEVPLLYDYSIEEVRRAKEDACVEQVNINSPTDPMGMMNGYAAIPGQEEEFHDSILKAVEYAHALDCKMIHVIAGIVESPTAEHDEVFMKNVRLAVSIFEKEGIVGLLEPCCKYAVPNYYLDCFHKTMKIIEEVDSPHLKLQLDLYHLQSMKGDLYHSFEWLLPQTAFVQIAQVPHRHEPDVIGELDYHYVFRTLKEMGYKGWISLEHTPAKGTDKGLGFLKEGKYEDLERI